MEDLWYFTSLNFIGTYIEIIYLFFMTNGFDFLYATIGISL